MKKINGDFTRKEIIELAKEFKRRRNFLGYSQLKLAKLANLSQSIITKLENGKIDPTYSTILKIEKALTKEETISNVKAENIMNKNIISIKNNNKIFEALEIMRNGDFSQLIVLDKNNNLIGTIYEKTILDAITKKIDIYTTSVEKFIDISPIIVPKGYSSSELSFIFQNKNTKFVVVGEHNKILGIITKSDLFKNL